MPDVLMVLGGLIVALGLGFVVRRLLDQVRYRDLNVEGIKNDDWKKVMRSEEAAVGNRIIGWLERALYFLAIVTNAYAALAGLLAFKVASKWAVWQHIERFPQKFGNPKLEAGTPGEFESWKTRYAVATYYLQNFLIGTFANVLCAAAGVAVVHSLRALGA